MLLDFKNSVTIRLSSKFTTMIVSDFPLHVKCVTTLPTEIQNINNSNSFHLVKSRVQKVVSLFG